MGIYHADEMLCVRLVGKTRDLKPENLNAQENITPYPLIDVYGVGAFFANVFVYPSDEEKFKTFVEQNSGLSNVWSEATTKFAQNDGLILEERSESPTSVLIVNKIKNVNNNVSISDDDYLPYNDSKFLTEKENRRNENFWYKLSHLRPKLNTQGECIDRYYRPFSCFRLVYSEKDFDIEEEINSDLAENILYRPKIDNKKKIDHEIEQILEILISKNEGDDDKSKTVDQIKNKPISPIFTLNAYEKKLDLMAMLFEMDERDDLMTELPETKTIVDYTFCINLKKRPNNDRDNWVAYSKMNVEEKEQLKKITANEISDVSLDIVGSYSSSFNINSPHHNFRVHYAGYDKAKIERLLV